MEHPDAQRFWAKVDKGPGCWTWTAHKNRTGYGKFYFEGNAGSLAHRVAWALAYGDPPVDKMVCHHCDNPACVRPDHLFLGTCEDNHKDKARKGRCRNGWDTGVMQGRSLAWKRMSASDVERIHALHGAGVSQSNIAKMVGFSPMTVSRAIHRGHKRPLPDARKPCVVLTDDLARAIHAERQLGKTYLEIGKKFGCSYGTVSNAVRRQSLA
jgi:hypothetical protein